MNVLILAAGYATRLYPLTLNKAKPLLAVGGKPIIEWLVDNLAGIPDLETIYVVTNDKFAADFQAWSQSYQKRHPEFKFKIVNDGSTSDDDKLGAIGDINFVVNAREPVSDQPVSRRRRQFVHQFAGRFRGVREEHRRDRCGLRCWGH